MKYIAAILITLIVAVLLTIVAPPVLSFALISFFSFEDKARIEIYFSDTEIQQAIESKQWTYAGRDGSDYIYLKFSSQEDFKRLIEKRKQDPTFTHSDQLITSDFSYGSPSKLKWWTPNTLKQPEILYNGYGSKSERFPPKAISYTTVVMYFSQQTLELYYANITF